MRRLRGDGVVAVVVVVLGAAGCGPDPGFLSLGPPIEGVPGATWIVLKHVDLDPGSGVRTVAGLAYAEDGHDGTDFAIQGLPAMVEGVSALAPAAGEVAFVRDGEWDRCATESPPPAGRECGNTVAIAHRDGWMSQLCHLRNGSVLVRKGDRVSAGQPLASVGWSGLADLPHVHYRLSRNGVVVDPYLGPQPERPRPMWRDPERVPMAHPVIWDHGFSDGEVDYDLAAGRPGGLAVISDQAPAILAYAVGYTNTPDTEWKLRITDPAGQGSEEMLRATWLARGFRFTGKRRRMDQSLAVGTWTAEVQLVVGGVVTDAQTWSTEVTAGAVVHPPTATWEGCAAEAR